MSYHQPVLATESIDLLNIKPDGIYVDATFGGGGHSRLILERLGDQGMLQVFDQDEDARANLPEDSRLVFNQHNFRFVKRFLKLHGIEQVDGLLADLGVSSHQLDTPERGFSYRFEAQLDMRMNQAAPLTASQVLNTYSAEELQRVFGQYGEVRNAKTLARRIAQAREAKPLLSVGDLVGLTEPLIIGSRARYLSQLFQALRIEVNDEMGALETLLEDSMELLSDGGRLVVISYHSVEDRMVKHFLRTGNVRGEVEKDFYGNHYRPFKILTKKAITPSGEEVADNPRARSAKMRAGEKR